MKKYRLVFFLALSFCYLRAAEPPSAAELMTLRANNLVQTSQSGRLHDYRLQLSSFSNQKGSIEIWGGPVMKDDFASAADVFLSCDAFLGSEQILKLAAAMKTSFWKKRQPNQAGNGGNPRAFFQIIGPWNRVHIGFLIDPEAKSVSIDGGTVWYTVDQNLIDVLTVDFAEFINGLLPKKSPKTVGGVGSDPKGGQIQPEEEKKK